MNDVKTDSLCLIETRCDDVDMVNVELIMRDTGFSITYKNRGVLSRYRSGGIRIAVKDDKSFNWKILKDTSEAFISIMLDKKYVALDKNIVVSSVYIPPSNSKYANIEFFEELENIC